MKNILLLVLLIVFILPFRASASTINATTCEFEDVQTAIDSSFDGDIVTVPAGSCTYSTYLPLDKEIEIIGAGVDNTTITNYGFAPTDGTDNWRITGFTFTTTLTSSYNAIRVDLSKSGQGLNLRIDHNRFNGYHYGVYLEGRVTGVIDNNDFIQGGIQYDGDDDAAWGRVSALGTADFLFIETNTIDNGPANNMLHAFTGARGARVVFRYNVLTETGSSGIPDPFDTHGYCHGPNDRGTRVFEMYENTFTRSVDGCCRALFLRGGTGVVFDNYFDETNGEYNWYSQAGHDIIFLTEGRYIPGFGTTSTCPSECNVEEFCDDPGGELSLGLKCCDQIGQGVDQSLEPVYIWDNTFDNSTVTAEPVIPHVDSRIPVEAIVLDENYVLSAPVGYTPYTYPHPLTIDNCTETTCIAEGWDCGTPSDGCGGVLDCSTCSGTDTCESFVCTACVPLTCNGEGWDCDNASDECGGTIPCGSCSGTDFCANNVCQVASTGTDIFKAYFPNEIGLSPTIDIIRLSDNVVVDNGTMINVGLGIYKYLYDTVGTEDYEAVADGDAPLTGADRYKQCTSTIVENKLDSVASDISSGNGSLEGKIDILQQDVTLVLTDTNSIQTDTTVLLVDVNGVSDTVDSIKDDTITLLIDTTSIDSNVDDVKLKTETIDWTDVDAIKDLEEADHEIIRIGATYYHVFRYKGTSNEIVRYRLPQGTSPAFIGRMEE